ncbi:D-2-hydroxyacid dehydrogenase [Salinimonas marina]|uniref:D-2-hydroxyacid dehydrogenase n=1 Tax=Salinimonas marina TaxID=2785918 RepID=A0A7S9DX84_9ALTE|nr:D-2-hydroxyacid dehydrogenase [Salinimonas marina]QPG05636.1 D-2-hydroxyacid dehydrogenase [Salinimonas marina]
MKGVILDFDTLKPDELSLAALQRLPVDWQIYPHTSNPQIKSRIAKANIVLTNKVILQKEVLEHSACRYIGVLATGTNNIDTQYCAAHSITVANVEGYGTGSVAQHALMLLLNLCTAFVAYHRDVQAGAWQQAKQFCLNDHPVQQLSGKHLVVVGTGQTGQAFSHACEALGMQVTACARPGSHNDPRPQLNELLPGADVVSLHCPLTAATDKLINRERLALMKSSALLINTARGDLIDEQALLEALQQHRIGGAGLDVLSQEPPGATHPLLQAPLDNLLITPHSAWLAVEARQCLLDIACGHIARFLDTTT